MWFYNLCLFKRVQSAGFAESAGGKHLDRERLQKTYISSCAGEACLKLPHAASGLLAESLCCKLLSGSASFCFLASQLNCCPFRAGSASGVSPLHLIMPMPLNRCAQTRVAPPLKSQHFTPGSLTVLTEATTGWPITTMSLYSGPLTVFAACSDTTAAV